MGLIKEFRDFAIKGNLVDIAVGFVMGVAFTAVTTTFINGIVMPLVSLIVNKDFSAWKWSLKEEEKDATGAVITPAIEILYGTFISAIIYFIIVAFVMFLLVKALNNLKRKEVAVPLPPPLPTNEELLLMEIRDLLRK